MNRRDFVKASAGSLLAYSALSPLLARAAGGAAARPGGKPNIIVILADDLGYGELGCQGGKDIPTPNIDSIARGGVRFTNGYVSCPVCSPTRAGLLTGRYQQRFGHEFNPGPLGAESEVFGLPLGERTIADRMKPLGYATGMVGKWHLGVDDAHLPTSRGFDEFFGFLGGAHPYFFKNKNAPILRGTRAVDEDEYLTDAFARESAAFIERHQASPFFLYLPFNAVHAPLQATDERLGRYGGIANKRRRTFAAMLDALDNAVGITLQKLRNLGMEENTLIVFLSDNGGPTLKTSSKNGALNGYKGQVYEGGIRVPYMVQWKGVLPAGTTYDNPVISLDIVPTALDAAGGHAADPDKIDGVSLLPYLQGNNAGAPHDRLFWRYGQQFAVRSGDWKLARLDQGDPMLFNLADDIGEKNDLAAAHPEKLSELLTAYNEWNAGNIDPLWQRGSKKSGRKNRSGKKRKN